METGSAKRSSRFLWPAGIAYCTVSCFSPGASGAATRIESPRRFTASGETSLSPSSRPMRSARQQPAPGGSCTIGRHSGALSAIEQHNQVEHVSGAVFAGLRDHQVPCLQRHRGGAGGVVHDDPNRGVRLRGVGVHRRREILDAGVACADQIEGGGVGTKAKTNRPRRSVSGRVQRAPAAPGPPGATPPGCRARAWSRPWSTAPRAGMV